MKPVTMKPAKTTILLLLALLLSLPLAAQSLAEVDSFEKGVPVWAKGREKERNLNLAFRQTFELKQHKRAFIRIAASSNYRLRINGRFVAHGPCVAAHGFYRVDCYDVQKFLHRGCNIIAIEVAGYNEKSYYLLDQPSFLQAELEVDGKIVAATGDELLAYELGQRKADVPRLSFQRPSIEHYTFAPDHKEWATSLTWRGVEPVELTVQEHKNLIKRRVPYPDYTVHEATVMGDNPNIFKFRCNSTGFVGLELTVSEPTRLKLMFDELRNADGSVGRHAQFDGRMFYDLQPGNYRVESFEPYTMQYLEVITLEGACSVNRVYMRDYCNSDVARARFESDNEVLNRLFEAARETYRQNALDIFMDCPSRERAGWLCDSYFTARAAFDLSGNTRLEHNFIENYLLPDEFGDIDKGMLPMCYPADHWNHNYIPNWAMWFVLQLEEYLYRSGDRATIDQARSRVYDLVDYFKPYLNSDGLLEKLPKWIFVEWSAANRFVQDVNYPTNMLYAAMLDVVARLYDDPSLAAQAEAVREVIRRESFDGEFFVDNAVRNADGQLIPTDNHTETCQYYAFYLGVATPESHPALWRRMRDEFGPARKEHNPYPDVPFSNAFIGNYLRLELLSREGLSQQILDESIAEYTKMVELTGTLWEHLSPTASCNHGFASHLAHVLNRDVLGIYDINPARKVITLRFTECSLGSCKGSIPIGKGAVVLEWTMNDGKVDALLSLPKGYRYEIDPTSLPATIHKK